MTDDTASVRLRPNPGVVFREDSNPVGEEAAVLFHPGENRAFTLNSTGVRIWHELDARPTRAELVERILASTDHPPDDAAASLSDFLDSLLAQGLVEIDD